MRKQQNFQWGTLSLGTCYYPEQWDRSLWADDLKRMQKAGIQTIRIGEFAWTIMEPTEGQFTFAFFDDFLSLAKEAGMNVIFGTPTATPPAWLTEKYPEVLNARMDGVLYRHGMRRHYNYNSPLYQEKVKTLVEKMGEHLAGHPAIIGWQIDNEINCETAEFYSESDTLAFREFLKARYETLDELNAAWGTVFWNQTYSAWEEIYVPRTTIHNSVNPHLQLDYLRFVSHSAIQFCKMQADILRKYLKPGDFITTNGMFGNLDNHRLMDESLDVYTYDSYLNFAFGLGTNPGQEGGLDDRRWSEHLTQVRSICPHFGIMEQQSGPGGWNTRMIAPSPKPGQLTLWAMQSIAHGSDFVSFFRWRTGTRGTEMYWYGILDYDNQDNRRLKEVTALGKRLKALGEVAGARNVAQVGMLRDFENTLDSSYDIWHQRLTWASEEEIFAACQLSHTPLDYVQLSDSTTLEDLQGYEVLFYPHPEIASQERADLLEKYVKQGGILILGARSGMKGMNGECCMTPIPGVFAKLTGSKVTDFTFIGPADKAQHMDWDGNLLPTGVFSDILEPTDAEVLATYSDDYYRGAPALLERHLGEGRALHYGGTFTRALVDAFLVYTGVLSPCEEQFDLPDCCELVVREKARSLYYFILNYSGEEQDITIFSTVMDLDTGKSTYGNVTLEPYGVKVYKDKAGKE